MDNLVSALKAAAEPTRLRIIALCLHGELTVSELVKILGQSQPRISRHLKLLADAGLLERIREGSWVFYRLAGAGLGAELSMQLSALLPKGDALIKRDLAELAAVKQDRNETAARYFNENAENWDKLRSLHVDDAEVEATVCRLLPVHDAVCSIESLLDVGTGTGRMLELLGPDLKRGEGVDLSPEMLRVARANLDSAELSHCRVRQADIFRLPFDASCFDAAIIHQVLHFVDDPAQAVYEAARTLVPGGRLVVVDFAPHTLENLRQDHAHRRLGFEEREICGWFAKAGLETREVVHLAGSPLTVTLWLGQKQLSEQQGLAEEHQTLTEQKPIKQERALL